MGVFVCDDTAEHRALIRAVLGGDADLEIVGEATDGAACLSGIARTAPDVVVLDLHMPGTDGWHVLHNLLATEHHPRVIVVSSDLSAGDRLREDGIEFAPKRTPADALRTALRGLARERPRVAD